MLSEAHLGYLAGILDGEGHFSICKYARADKMKRHKKYGLKVECRITQARRLLLDTIASWLPPGATNIAKAGKGGAYYMLRFNYACLRVLIQHLLPYLILKGRQAEICLYFLNHPHTTGCKPEPEAEWQHRLNLWDECRQLNITPQKLERLGNAGSQYESPVPPSKGIPHIVSCSSEVATL